MAIVLIPANFDPKAWCQAIRAIDSQLDIRVWPDIGNADEIDFALVWSYPPGELKKYKNLQCISSMGAGVDHIIHDPDLPKDVPIVRVVDPLLTRDMTQYVTMAILNYTYQLQQYRQFQQQGQWYKLQPLEATVGIMGLGKLGLDAAVKLRDLGFTVTGWSNSHKQIPGIQCFHDQQLDNFLAKTNILACLLPLTPQTKNILNRKTLSSMPANSFLINVARGALLVEDDLVDALNHGHLAGAWLDVFQQEPLPPEHPFWTHPKITITPHIASVPRPQSVASQIVENYYRMLNKQPLNNQIDPAKGY